MILFFFVFCFCLFFVCFFFFFALKQRMRVHISEQAGLCRICRSPEEIFSCSQHKMGYSRILLLVLIELRQKKAWPEVIKLFFMFNSAEHES